MKKRWQDWCNVVLGAWLFLAPFWMSGFNTSNQYNACILGILIVAMAGWALTSPGSVTAERWSLGFGVWTFITPWVLGFSASGAPAWNSWIVGALVALLSYSAMTELGATHKPAH